MMKKILLLALLFPVLSIAQQNRIGKVSQAITAAKTISGEFQSFEIFNSQTEKASENYSDAVNDGVVVAIDQAKINEIRNQDPKQMQLSIPFKSNGETVALDLIQVAVFSPDFKAITNNGDDITNEVDFGKHYRGIIAGNPNSLVSISVFESQISGFIANEEGNYTIGKLEDSDVNHIIYFDSDLKNATQEIFCSTEDNGVSYTEEELSPPPSSEQSPGDEIDVYIESGATVWAAQGGNIENVVIFITGIFTQSYVLYANDGIQVRTSNMMIWVTQDPYNGPDSLSQLQKFREINNTNQPGIDADIGHLIERQNYGGIGYLNTLCDNSFNVVYSGLANNSVITVPTYSWNVMVITHEMGHAMGSSHTHACVWNGDNTAIDGCVATEGSCPQGPIPSSGGTIMSYCHFQSVGINFNNGFGPQPQALILNRIATASCLDPEDESNPPVAVCKATPVVQLNTNGEAFITVADIDGGSYDNDEIVSMSIDIDTFDCEDVGFNNVTLTVTDNDGLTSTCVGFVEVVDSSTMVTTCPQDFIVSIPAGTSYELLDYRDEIIIVTDICSVIPAATSQSPNVGTSLPLGVNVITVNALLNDGDVVSCSFEITIDNNLELADNSILSSLLLYPNPASEIVKLGNPQNLDLETISIYDMMGRLIKLVDLNGMKIEQLINVSELSKANYFVIIKGEQTKIIKQLIIK